MLDFLQNLKQRNEILFYFGLVCLLLSILFLILSTINNIQIYGANAWFKPFKFSFSTLTFVWAMAWYCYYLPNFNAPLFSWSIIILLGFEIIYITLQASRGQLSHYNLSTPFYALMFSLMAIAATLATLYTAYVGVLFCINEFPLLPSYYLWAIRLGIFIFVIFSFEGFAMGSGLNHSVGGFNENSNLFILGWSKTIGDLRVSHFIGMHALQVLPIISYYLLKNIKLTFVFCIFYVLLALTTLIQALQGKPLIKVNNSQNIISK